MIAAKHKRRLRRTLGCLGLMLIAGLAMGATRFTDLRRVEPIRGNAAAGEKKASVCYACHGANGVPIAPTFPRLAGQRADYLYRRLVSFRKATPNDPYYSKSPMMPIAATLSDSDMRDLATYFSTQTPPASNAENPGPSATAGQALFLQGNPARGIPPCQGCHGSDANGTRMVGNQYVAYPSLRGQSPLYLIARLTSFREGLPADTSNAFVMGGVARALDDDSIQSIAAWLGSLSPMGSRL